MNLQLDDKTLRSMTVAERIALADRIWDTIDEDTYVLSPALKRELERRLADLDANPDEGSPWEEVRARIRAKLRASKSTSVRSPKRKQPRRLSGMRNKKKA